MDNTKIIESILKNGGTVTFIPPHGDTTDPGYFKISIGKTSATGTNLDIPVSKIINLAFINLGKK